MSPTEERTINPLTPLYCRYNGTMLGFFLQLAGTRVGADRFEDLQFRMMQFIEELELGVELAETHEEFAEHRTIYHSALVETLPRVSNEMTLAFGVGFAFGGVVLDRPVLDRELLSNTAGLLGLEPGALFDRAEAVLRDGASAHIDDLMTAGLEVVSTTLAPVEPESTTCFVAIPFKPPFLNYYSDVYRPLLGNAGFSAVRAWGSIGDERYNHVLLTLINKCGAFLADVTGHNPNVMYELGFAVGQGKPWFAFADERVVQPDIPVKPSNLGGEAVHPYNPTVVSWPTELVEEWGPEFVEVIMKIFKDRELASEDRGDRLGLWGRLKRILSGG